MHTRATPQQVVDYKAAAAALTTGRHDFRIPAIVVDDWLASGSSTPLGTKDLARRFGTSRRTICGAIRRLTDAGLIVETGKTVWGQRAFAPCLEKGAEWRRAQESVDG